MRRMRYRIARGNCRQKENAERLRLERLLLRRARRRSRTLPHSLHEYSTGLNLHCDPIDGGGETRGRPAQHTGAVCNGLTLLDQLLAASGEALTGAERGLSRSTQRVDSSSIRLARPSEVLDTPLQHDNATERGSRKAELYVHDADGRACVSEASACADVQRGRTARAAR